MIIAIVAIVIVLVVVLLVAFSARNKKRKSEKAHKDALLKQISDALLLLNVRHEKLDDKSLEDFNSWHDVQSAFKVRSEAIDHILIVCSSSGSESYYQLQYVVSQNLPENKKKMHQVRISENRTPPVLGDVTSLDWRGDDELSLYLAADSLLNDLIIKAKNEVKGFRMWVNPSMIGGYAAVNSTFNAPTLEIYDAVERIAGAIRLYYNDALPSPVFDVQEAPVADSIDDVPTEIKEAVVIGAESLVSENLNKTGVELETSEHPEQVAPDVPEEEKESILPKQPANKTVSPKSSVAKPVARQTKKQSKKKASKDS